MADMATESPIPPSISDSTITSLKRVSIITPIPISTKTSSYTKPGAEEEDLVASFKKMLDDILDNAAAQSELLSQDLETSLNSKVNGYGLSTSTNYLSLSSPASVAADRARLTRSTTLGYLLPQPKNHLSKLKVPQLSESNVDPSLLHKLEEQNNMLPPQDSTSFLLARLERQNELLDTDPKSVCIESNVLKGNLSTLQRLIADSTALNSPNTATVDPITSSKIMEPQEGDEEIDWEFWGMLVQDYNAVARKLPHLLAARVRQGLPSKLRGLVWQSMSQASSTYLETMYTQLLKEQSPYERIIQRDLARTFPQIDMFKEEGGKGQEGLRNILKAYSLYDPHVGYCQGLGFLVGPLLMNMDEREAFCVFVRMMETYDMRTMFTLNMEGLQLRLYQFSALLTEHLPMLHAHLSFHSIQPAMYASQWFLSLFAYTYPLPLVLRIYDVVFSEGAPETIMRVAVAFLKKNEEKLMQLQEFEDLLDMLSTKLYEVYEDNAGEVIRDAMALSTEITKDKLDALAVSYVAELEDQQKRTGEVTSKRFRDRFGVPKSFSSGSDEPKSPTNITAARLDKPKATKAGSRLSIAASFGSSAALLLGGGASSNEDEVAQSSASSITIRTPTGAPPSDSMLLDQIQDLAKALSTLQREHVEVTESLVMTKMEKSQHLEELDSLRKKVIEMERQQNRASMMSAMAPSVMSNSDGAESVMISSPRTITYDDGKMRTSSSWSRHSQDDDLKFTEDKYSPVSSLGVSQDDLANRLLAAERELAHVTAELVNTKVSAMEAMNEAEAQRTKAQKIEKVMTDSKEAVKLLQEQQMGLQDSKLALIMERDTARHEENTIKKEMAVMRVQFEETKRLWLEGQVERHNLQEKVKELEMNASFNASSTSLSRGRTSRKSLNDTAMFGMITSRSGSSSPRASALMTPLCETPEGAALSLDGRRASGESLASDGTRITARRGSTDTMGSLHSNSNGRESMSSSRPAALVRKGWPSEKAASVGVVPSSAVSTGTRKFVVSPENETKMKRNSANRNSILGALSFRRSDTS